MKKIYLLVFILLFSFSVFSQNVTISGYVQDINSAERLIGANVFDADNLKYGTSTNSYGFYSLTLPKGKVKLTASYFTYGFWQEEIVVSKDTVINIEISSDVNIEEVVVQAQNNQIESSQMSRIDIPLATVKVLPSLFGETDVLKAIQLMPGVSSGNEGTSGIYVRGGGPDQNIILLDGVPVYNVNHLFGFFSVFSADAISNVTLYKGGFPARYGGRLSSVLDINLKEGNMRKYTGSVSVGIIASKFTVEGPIVKDKTSFIISARRTYIDVLAAPIIKLASMKQDNMNVAGGYYFYDVISKINHKLSQDDRIFFSIYAGKDKAYVNMTEEYEKNVWKSKMKLGWGNIISALRWNHVFTPRLFGNLTLTYSRFNFMTDIYMEEEYYDDDDIKHISEIGMRYNSGIDDISAKIDFDFNPNINHKIKYGAIWTFHIFNPGANYLKWKTDNFDIDTVISKNILYGREYAAYFEDDFKIGSILKINLGGRFSAFHVRDTLFYSPEPRVAVRIMFTEKWSVKASYAQMKQYIHFLTNNTLGMPTDLWMPATDLVIPQKSIQYAVGTSIGITDKINLTVEAFYKDMYNLVELKEGESVFGIFESAESSGSNWEKKVEQGKGYSQGIEVLLEKKTGKFNGWIGYTLAFSNRQFENISFGEVFPYRYDRRHDISVVATYKFNDNLNVALTWVFATGNPVTLSQIVYKPYTSSFGYDTYYDWERIQYFEKRNNYRLPSYHRLDIGLNWSKEVKLGNRTWSFGAYNAYNHLNPFFVDFQRYTDSEIPTLRVYSLFPIIPSISYRLDF